MDDISCQSLNEVDEHKFWRSATAQTRNQPNLVHLSHPAMIYAVVDRKERPLEQRMLFTDRDIYNFIEDQTAKLKVACERISDEEMSRPVRLQQLSGDLSRTSPDAGEPGSGGQALPNALSR
jgi:hypothetical protein